MKNSKETKSTISRIFTIASHSKVTYVFGLTLSTIGIMTTGIPYFSIYVIIKDLLTALQNGTEFSFEMALPWVTLTFASIVVGVVLSIAGSFCCHFSAFKVLYHLRMQIMERMGSFDLGFYSNSRVGGIQKTMNENIDKLEEFLSHTFPNILGAGGLLSILCVFLLSVHLPIAIILFTAIAIAFFIQYRVYGGESGKRIWTELNRATTNMDAEFSEYISGIEEEKIFGNSQKTAKKLTMAIEQNRIWWKKFNKKVSPFGCSYRIIILSSLSIIIIAGTMFFKLSPDSASLMINVLAFMIVGPVIFSPMMELVEVGSDTRNVAVRLNQIDEILNTSPMQEPIHSEIPTNYDVCFENVSFSYQAVSDPLRTMALKNINVRVLQGEMTALVGPSGGGKSTMGQLIPRYWDIEKGKITIGGIDIRKIKNEDLMNLIAFVFQDTYIFTASVAENISMNREVPREKIEQAAKIAQLHNFIISQPNGYETRLGSGGHVLSGGEAQRLSIARAFLKDSPIVVLDEAMAYADPESELLLRKAILELMKNKTVIIIAHRLYSIQNAGQIVVLDKGEMVEKGSHSELLSKQGLYAHLWNIQNNTEQWMMSGGGIA